MTGYQEDKILWNMKYHKIWDPVLTRYQDHEIWWNMTTTQVHNYKNKKVHKVNSLKK